MDMVDGHEMVTITVQRSTLEAAINCVEACATDRGEPERYREWYSAALTELQTASEA